MVATTRVVFLEFLPCIEEQLRTLQFVPTFATVRTLTGVFQLNDPAFKRRRRTVFQDGTQSVFKELGCRIATHLQFFPKQSSVVVLLALMHRVLCGSLLAAAWVVLVPTGAIPRASSDKPIHARGSLFVSLDIVVGCESND